MKRILLILLTLSSFPILLSAQDTQEDPATLLPDINPQDIEIRGEFRARFPGITRQPILGFSPSPRVFRIDPNRLPFLETPDQVIGSVELSQLESYMGPPRELQDFPNQSRFFGYAGFGMFTSPETDLFADIPLTSRSKVTGNLNFISSDGYIEEDPDSPFRRFNTHISYRNRLNLNNSLVFNLRAKNHFTEFPMPDYFADQSEAYRNGFELFGAEVGFVRKTSSFDNFEVYANFNQTSTTRNPLMAAENNFPRAFTTTRTVENRITLGGFNQWTGRQIGHVYSVQASYDGGWYNSLNTDFVGQGLPLNIDLNWYIANAEATWQNQTFSDGRWTLGLKLFTGYDADEEQTFMVAPLVMYEKGGSSPLRFKAKISGDMTNPGFEGAFLATPITSFATPLINQRRYYGEANVDFDLADFFTVHGGLHISHTSRPIMHTGILWSNPDELFLVRPSAGLTFNISPRWLTIYGNAEFNIANLDDEFVDDYYGLEKYRITAGLRTAPFEGAVLRGWIDYIGPRENFRDDSKLGQALLLNIMAEYRVGGNFGVYVKGINMLNEDYMLWDDYREMPFAVFGGITFRL